MATEKVTTEKITTEKNLTKWIEKSINDDTIVVFERGRVEIEEELGAGAFSRVHRASLKVGVNPITVAVKIFKNSPEIEVDDTTNDDLIKEIRLLRSVGFHPNILNFHGVSKDPRTEMYMLILEYADGGSLRKYMSNNRALSGSERIRLAKEIVSGVSCLHAREIIHRDLNSANILVHEHHIKIADLGLSKKAEPPNTVQDPRAISKIHGHLQYIDPQCFQNVVYKRTRKSDVYSIGVVFWELSSGRVPFPNLSSAQAIAHIINGLREESIAGTPQEFIDLYTKCWDQKPENRPEISEVHEKLERIKWGAEVTSTGSVSPVVQPDVDTSTTISQELNDVHIMERIPGEVVLLLREFLDSGREIDDFRNSVKEYLKKNEKKEEHLFEMLMSESNGDKKHPHALLFGFCYYKGIGVDRNYGKALDIFRGPGSDDDTPDHYAQYFLGECYRSGFGVNADRENAFYWYRKSAEGGTLNGQYELADCYRYGFGTEKDIEEAKRWYRKAADKKHFMALTAINDESWQTEE